MLCYVPVVHAFFWVVCSATFFGGDAPSHSMLESPCPGPSCTAVQNGTHGGTSEIAPPLVAVGVVSAPTFLNRREALRASWLTSSLVGRGRPIRVLFVVRALGIPSSMLCQLTVEQRQNDDIFRAAVPWNESRLRGPVLSLAAWLQFAAKEFHAAPFIAKMDDDAYVHVADLLVLLRTAQPTSPQHSTANEPHATLTYMGAMSWFHWYPAIFERSGFGFTFNEAWKQGRFCRNQTTAEQRCRHAGCGRCVGPFPFAAGFLVILSTPLAAALARSPGLQSDLATLRATPQLVTRKGRKQGKLMEDIWLGSLLYRFPPPQPVRYVALSELYDPSLISDNWGLRARQTALLVHIRGKQLERFLVMHDFMTGEDHCSYPHLLECEHGCGAFDVALTEIDPFRSPRIALPRRAKRLLNPRIKSSSVCSATQQNATYCRLRPSPNQARCRKIPQKTLSEINDAGVNLLPRVQNAKAVLLKRIAQRKERVLQAGTTRLVANACGQVGK